VDELKALVFGEVGVVLDVKRGERQFTGDAAGGDPGVVDRTRTPTEPGVSLDLAQDGGGPEAARHDEDTGEEDPQAGAVVPVGGTSTGSARPR
jgi:hypothetical protein